MNHQDGASDKRTVVDEGTSFKGALSSKCPIDVRGRIEGDVETPALNISATGAVHGRVKVGSVQSEGEIAGEFTADHVELAGSVLDNTVIRARSLEVKLSSERGRLQVVFGECELSVGDEPTEHAFLPVIVEQSVSAHPLAPSEPEPEPALVPEELAAASELTASEPLALESSDSELLLAGNEQASSEAPEASEAAPAAADDASELEQEHEEEAQASHAEINPQQRRSRRKTRNGASDGLPLTGWSQPPSQPPPAS